MSQTKTQLVEGLNINTSAPADALAVDNNGRVGIGTTSPTTPIHCEAAQAELQLKSTTGTNSAGVRFVPGGQTNAWYIYANGSRNLVFDDHASERMRIDSSGRLLIGTSTAPSGSTTQYPSLSVVGNSAGGANYGAMNLCRSEASANITQDEPIGQINFGDSGAGHYAHIKCSCDGNAGTDDYPGRIQFYTTRNGAASPTERMVITRDGTHRMFSATNFDTLELRYQGSADTGNDIQQCYRDASMTTGVLVCRIRSDGNLQNTNGSYTQISDAKLKENIVDAGSQWDDLKAIQIRNWNFKAETGYETHRQIGPIAQELEEVCPNLVFDTPDKDEEGNDLGTVTKGVNQSVLYMKAVKALQEAMERIETLETANASLEARLTALEGGAA